MAYLRIILGATFSAAVLLVVAWILLHRKDD